MILPRLLCAVLLVAEAIHGQTIRGVRGAFAGTSGDYLLRGLANTDEGHGENEEGKGGKGKGKNDKTDSPSVSPSSLPSSAPSMSPSRTPSATPTRSMVPSFVPTFVPSSTPSMSNRPTLSHSPSKSQSPTSVPSMIPSTSPTRYRSPVEKLLAASYARYGGIEFTTSDTTYWMKALRWVESTDTTGLPAWRIGQRYAMACIFYATNGIATDYTNSLFGPELHGFTFDWLIKWIDPATVPAVENECQFYGVVCNANNEVTELNLKSNWLTGSFPIEAKILGPSLQVLDLEFNMVSNRGDEETWFLKDLVNLRVLSLGKTGFQYDGLPPYLRHLTQLTDLDIYSTLFFGPLDETIFANMAYLKYIDLGALDFDSPFPSTLKDLAHLEYVYLDYSGFYDLDSFLGNGTDFQSLRELWIDDNPINTDIPTTIGSISTLESLGLSGCGLTGPIPAELSQLPSLKQVWLSDNYLSGAIPDGFGNLNTLERFVIQGNNLGAIPSSICMKRAMKIMEVFTADCDICNFAAGESPAFQNCCSCCGQSCE